MSKGSLSDVQEACYKELERLMGCKGSSQELECEIARAGAVVSLAGVMIDNANTMVRALQIADEAMSGKLELPEAVR